jgi:hypothetical protein
MGATRQCEVLLRAVQNFVEVEKFFLGDAVFCGAAKTERAIPRCARNDDFMPAVAERRTPKVAEKKATQKKAGRGRDRALPGKFLG